MDRTTCEHFVPIDLTCDKCNTAWETIVFELLHGYRNTLLELSIHLNALVPKNKEYDQIKKELADSISALEKKYKKLK